MFTGIVTAVGRVAGAERRGDLVELTIEAGYPDLVPGESVAVNGACLTVVEPGPGRFRQFMQFDADTIGTPTMAADAEMCMLAADTMEALGVQRGSYVVKVSNRKILDSAMDALKMAAEKRLTTMRAIDKLDRLGIEGVKMLLGPGRKDESGDFTKGAELDDAQIGGIVSAITEAGRSSKGVDTAGEQELSEIASSFLTDLTRGRYDELELNEDYEPLLLDDGASKPVISGGEEDVANLALRLAISQMIADRAGQPLSLLVLDEIFGSLDEDRRAAVVELLRSLADRFPQVILITHIDSVREGFDRVIRVDYDAARGVSDVRDDLEARHGAAA